MKEVLSQIWHEYSNEIKEGLLFSLFVMFGVLVKIIRAIYAGAKLSFFSFISEAMFSFFIAIIVYAVFDQFFQMKQLFVYAICAFIGSMSKIFQKKTEELLVAIFDALKTGVKDLIEAVIEKIKSVKL